MISPSMIRELVMSMARSREEVGDVGVGCVHADVVKGIEEMAALFSSGEGGKMGAGGTYGADGGFEVRVGG